MLIRHLHSAAFLAAALLATPLLADAPTSTPLQPNDLVAVCGDSITEQKLYSVFIEDYLLMCQPAPHVRTEQFGWSGDTAHGFLGNKLDNNVLRFHPTVVTTNFGMNDGLYNTITDEVAEKYRTTTQTIIDKLKAAGVHTIVIGSPGAVDSVTFKTWRLARTDPDSYNHTLSVFRDIDKELAEKNHVLFADVHDAMIDVMKKAKAKYGDDYPMGGKDGVHPFNNGHLVMAYAYLKPLVTDPTIATITIDQKAPGLASSVSLSPGHTLVSATTSAPNEADIVIESTRYPFCFTGKPEDPNGTAGVLQFLPFNDDLNRFTLIIKNPAAPKLAITWGPTTKTFTAEELAKGINLAAEFLDNPFSEQFQKVEAAVRAQQAFETPFIKQFVVNVPQLEKTIPDTSNDLTDIVAKGEHHDTELFTSAASLVIPIRHTIHIEPAR